VLPRLWKQHW